jgi:signal transduction histidine kinase
VTRRLLAGYLSLTLLILLVLEVPLGLTFADHERDQVVTEIERDAVVLSTLVEDALQQGEPIDHQVINAFADDTHARVVVVDDAGIGIIDTDPPSENERSFATRPEIIEALAGRVSSGSRHSETLDTELLYVAVPVASAGRVYGAVRLTYPADELHRRVTRYWWTLAAVGAVSLLAAVLLASVLARSIARPLRRLSSAAAAIGHGDLGARAGADEGPPVVRSLASAFDDMAARLEELVDAQDAFVADASHQLRNPLTALRLRLENLRAGIGPDLDGDVAGALAETARLTRIVDALLVLARADRDGAVGPEGTVDVAALVRGRCDAWRPLAEERDVDLRTRLPAAVPALATEHRLEQVVDNLLANALDAAPPRSVITVSVDGSGDDVQIHVVDEGEGMDPEERDRAFDRFWRASTASSADRLGGTGLGLSIVRKLVVADGGTVALEEGPNRGLDAVVRLRRP